MKPIEEMSLGEFAAFVCSHLRGNGIEVVLSGGACVCIYSNNRYKSFDLDFIENLNTSWRRLREVLSKIGFREEKRYFQHPKTKFFIEFPKGPITVGNEAVKDIIEMKFSTGTLVLISPTDSVKDRLAAYYHWQDKQALNQALLVARDNEVDIKEVERWSRKEGMAREFTEIKSLFEKK